MVTIDKHLCVGCGECVRMCCTDALCIAGGKAQPTGMGCIGCGHCMAICPRNAVSNPDWDKGQILPYRREDFTVDADHFMRFLKFRRSCRRFTDVPLREEELDTVLEAGRYAPTGSNKQKNRFVVAQGELTALKKAIWTSLAQYGATNNLSGIKKQAEKFLDGTADRDRLFFDATTVIFIISTSVTDGVIAATTMELMANAMGLGALYSGYTVRGCIGNSDMSDYLGLAPAEELCACLVLGHPDVAYRRTVYRKEASVIKK